MTSVVFDAPAIAASKAYIITNLGAASEVENKEDCEAPEILYDAFLLLTITTTGLDSTPGGSGGPITPNRPGKGR